MQPWEITLDDGGRLTGTRFGEGARVVLLLHGQRYEQSSWHPFAERLAAAGLSAITLDFRGYGASSGLPERASHGQDVAAAVRALRDGGAAEVCLLGGSMGGAAALEGAALYRAAVERIAVLSPAADPHEVAAGLPDVPLLILASRDEPFVEECSVDLHRLTASHAQLQLYEGAAHAQALLAGPHGADVEHRLLTFLTDGIAR